MKLTLSKVCFLALLTLGSAYSSLHAYENKLDAKFASVADTKDFRIKTPSLSLDDDDFNLGESKEEKKEAAKPVIDETDPSTSLLFSNDKTTEPKEVINTIAPSSPSSEGAPSNSLDTPGSEEPATKLDDEIKGAKKTGEDKVGKGAKKDTTINLADDSDEDAGFPGSSNKWISILFTVLALSVMFLIYWYQKHLKGKLKSSGVAISVLGQTFLDGGTRIILLKVGHKVLILAKSQQFCNTLDIITDEAEVNLLTLGSGLDQNDKEFSRVLKDMNRQSQKESDQIPYEAEIRQEINELKSKLGKSN